MNMKNGFGRGLTAKLLIAGLAWLSLSNPANAQLSSGSSDRTDNSFEVPGWFSKNMSDIARYPVPLIQPQAQQSSQSPLVVIQKGGTFGNPGVFSSKTILTPTPTGYVATGSSLPWVAPGAGYGGFGNYTGYGGFGGYNGLAGWGGGIPNIGNRIGGFSHYSSYIDYAGVPTGYAYGFNVGGAMPWMGGSGFGMAPFGIGRRVTATIVAPETKTQGNYYNSAQTGNSGNSYYSSNVPAVQPNAVTIPPKQSPKEYWGDSGSPFGKDLNSTPW